MHTQNIQLVLPSDSEEYQQFSFTTILEDHGLAQSTKGLFNTTAVLTLCLLEYDSQYDH